MKAGLAAGGLVLMVAGSAWAGELIFANGTRLQGDLANEALLVSTGAGLVEIVPEDVLALSREELRLRDGRVIHGTLVGGRLKARTALGEIAVRVDELEAYRSGSAAVAAPASPEPAASTPATAPGAGTSAAASPLAQPAGSPGVRPASVAGLPSTAAYQDLPVTPRPAVTTPVQAVSLQPAALGASSRRLEVLGGTPLYREALAGSAQVGHVARGQHVTYVDSIDRRLHILNRLIFDGGHWVKVRLLDGTEGWLPADRVRDVR
jgi:hypothetical protein